jgi:hypothetical protein
MWECAAQSLRAIPYADMFCMQVFGMNPQELQRARVESEKYHQALQLCDILIF